MRTKRSAKNKSLSLAAYFGILFFLIILISILFKFFDLVKNSKFDSKHRFTVAVLEEDNTNLISVSPQEDSLILLKVIGKASKDRLDKMSLPIDSFVVSKNTINSTPKSYFAKIFFNLGSVETDLSMLDLIKLGFYSSGVTNEKVTSQTVSINDSEKLSKFSSTLFVDPQILEEEVSVKITNSTDVSGLGNMLARYITNIGGNVVLVNSSQSTQNKSQILYRSESYALKRISQKLNVVPEKNEKPGAFDVIIIIGKDRSDIFEQ